MPKKILICEDDEQVAKALSRRFEDIGYISLVLAKNNQASYILNNIEKIVKEENPDYVIVDSLDGKWLEVSELAKKIKPNIVPIIYSGESNIAKYAKEKGYAAFNKPEESEALFEFIKSRET